MPVGFSLSAGGRQLKHEDTEIGRSRPIDTDAQSCVPKDVAAQMVLFPRDGHTRIMNIPWHIRPWPEVGDQVPGLPGSCGANC
jgi:hypothetical protein